MRRIALALAALSVAGCAAADGQSSGAASFVYAIKQAGRSLLEPPGERKTIISDVKPARYEVSTLAVGEEKDLARQRGEALGFVSSPALDRYLDRIRARVAAASGVSDIPGRVVVLANPAFAAYSTPDGNIYVAMGWLPYLQSEDEMAAIIAHELSHVVLTHHSADLLSGFQQRAQSIQELGMSAKMAVANRPPSRDEQRALQGSQLLTVVSEKMIMPAWNRRQEAEADLLGVDLLVRAEYSPVAMVTMLEKYQAWEKQTKEADEAFQARAGEVMKKDVAEGVKMTLNRLLENLSASHPETGRRLSDVASYLDRHYGELALPEPQTTAWSEMRLVPEVREVTRNYDLAFSARKLLERGKPSDAHAYARDAARGRTATDAYPNWILAKSATAVGRNSDAVAALERAIKANEPVREVYDEMIFVNEQQGNVTAALAWTDKASATFGEAARWRPAKIRLLRKSGRLAEATALTLTCTVETPEWRRLCQEANQTPAGAAAR
ncbi:MAG: hypothetical protein AUH30_20030 [Candidatus Rokubacteria bacterium 13_1_40CM_68_15]|nr:MAG: hypothetical protein AUH30_20030 [Candidatus Rokubacteria bacterium 13_1_40CM_68_15]